MYQIGRKDAEGRVRWEADKIPADELKNTLSDTICTNCDGAGVISYNPNLNANSFSGMAVATCGRCNGTGRESAE